ncbi:anti-sigma factor family protein [Acidihalobacter prosperus]|uniref:Zinc-finger domain-containing protein n=1 Tax=Acidihalobacter prosperus TaxID=160660 RepID=A0A1A6C829_9GAMM|nr:hypothetical protein [Acidihalobacter prosperus]OBS10705.1 hypothetical protein Thpro_020421 [Acidihalobacter prosperus]
MMGMISCREAGYYLSLEREQTLGWPLRAKLSMHLAVCRNCRRYRVQLRWIDQAMDSLAESPHALPLPDEARARIAAKLNSLNADHPGDGAA